MYTGHLWLNLCLQPLEKVKVTWVILKIWDISRMVYVQNKVVSTGQGYFPMLNTVKELPKSYIGHISYLFLNIQEMMNY